MPNLFHHIEYGMVKNRIGDPVLKFKSLGSNNTTTRGLRNRVPSAQVVKWLGALGYAYPILILVSTICLVFYNS
uniref:Uncharacterized protein n=1 Tax=Cannabis sativa TaxID=3483 RepID=A0A803NRG1_CANSA